MVYNINKKIIALSLCFSIFFSNFVLISEVFGQSYLDNTQAGLSVRGSGTKAPADGSAVSSLSSCAAGAVLGSIVSSGLQNIMTSVTSFLTKKLEGFTSFALDNITSSLIPAVPTSDQQMRRTINSTVGELDETVSSLVAKEVGNSFFGFSLPSLDSIGYCLINSIIAYISESTIRWINSGFEGNPAFIENFGQFFSDLADREMINFLEVLANTDLICDDLRIPIQRNLINTYTSKYAANGSNGQVIGSGKCSFGKTPQELSAAGEYPSAASFESATAGMSLADYSSGDPITTITGGWEAWGLAFAPENQIYTVNLNAKKEAESRIDNRQTITKIETVDANNGFLSAKDSNGNVYSPGGTIQGQLQKRVDLPDDRLILADEFDEIVTALIDKLVSIALDETIGKLNSVIEDVTEDTNSAFKDYVDGLNNDLYN